MLNHVRILRPIVLVIHADRTLFQTLIESNVCTERRKGQCKIALKNTNKLQSI